MFGGVLALGGRRALAQQRHAGQRRHRRRIASVLGRPVSHARLMTGEPLQPLAHRPLNLRVLRGGGSGGGGRQQGREEKQNAQAR